MPYVTRLRWNQQEDQNLLLSYFIIREDRHVGWNSRWHPSCCINGWNSCDGKTMNQKEDHDLYQGMREYEQSTVMWWSSSWWCRRWWGWCCNNVNDWWCWRWLTRSALSSWSRFWDALVTFISMFISMSRSCSRSWRHVVTVQIFTVLLSTSTVESTLSLHSANRQSVCHHFFVIKLTVIIHNNILLKIMSTCDWNKVIGTTHWLYRLGVKYFSTIQTSMRSSLRPLAHRPRCTVA